MIPPLHQIHKPNSIALPLTLPPLFPHPRQCSDNKCSFTLNPEVCNYCIHPNTDYTFSVAAVLSESQLGPAITINKKIGEYSVSFSGVLRERIFRLFLLGFY